MKILFISVICLISLNIHSEEKPKEDVVKDLNKANAGVIDIKSLSGTTLTPEQSIELQKQIQLLKDQAKQIEDMQNE